MERFDLGYSTKNIPYPDRTQYLKKFISKQQKFSTNLRWRAFMALDPNAKPSGKETFGFRTSKCPPLPNHPAKQNIIDFEKEFFGLARHIEFWQRSTPFQQQLKMDSKKIRNSKNVIVSSDKTANHYELPVDMYQKLLMDNITTNYKKTGNNRVQDINNNTAYFAEGLGLADRMEGYSQAVAFTTLKDHKEGFPGVIKCRLINPAKSQLGKVAKQKLEKINKIVRKATGLNQWHKTADVTEWFQNIKDKKMYKFFKFDLCEFYPSISEKILCDALEWAGGFTTISEEDKQIILQSCNSLLFTEDGEEWAKKNTNSLFDITMGAFHGAEACETTGLYILYNLRSNRKLFENATLGLYRDDGLAIVKGSGPKIDKLRKEVTAMFQELGFKITTEINITCTDFLDLILDLQQGVYKPFRKANQEILYIHSESNHPDNVKKQIPRGCEQRLRTLSSNQEIFNRAKGPYREALEKCGYKYDLQYQPGREEKKNKRQRKRKILWFNPPFSGEVRTNITRLFVNLLAKHFPKGTRLGKLFNKHNTKVSFSCTPNMKSIIGSHNRKVLQEKNDTDSNKQLCNCQRSRKASCPLEGKCLVDDLVYRADIEVMGVEGKKCYWGQSMRPFKDRWREHMTSFSTPLKDKPGNSIEQQIEAKKQKSELAAYIWKLKEEKKDFKISWHIQRKAYPYTNGGGGLCDLCAWEKYYILMGDPAITLNRRSELFFRCKSMRDCLLNNKSKFTPKPP